MDARTDEKEKAKLFLVKQFIAQEIRRNVFDLGDIEISMNFKNILHNEATSAQSQTCIIKQTTNSLNTRFDQPPRQIK
jgi:hypothetical protein